jgi:hypothetical protein
LNNFLITLKMEFRGRFGLGKNPSKHAWGGFGINMAMSAVIYAIFLAAAYFMSQMLLTGTVPMDYEFLVVATTVSLLVQFLTSTQQLVKVLYQDADSELLVRFPIDGRELYLAKSAYVLFHNLILAVLLTLPFYVYYGVFTSATAGYYVGAFFITLFSGLIPFFTAHLVSVPVMHLNNLVKNKFMLKFVLVTLLVIISFSAYMLILRGVLEYYKTQEATALFSDEILREVKAIASSLVPMSFFADILTGRRLNLAIPLSIVITLVLGAAGLFVGAKSFYPTLL